MVYSMVYKWSSGHFYLICGVKLDKGFQKQCIWDFLLFTLLDSCTSSSNPSPSSASTSRGSYGSQRLELVWNGSKCTGLFPPADDIDIMWLAHWRAFQNPDIDFEELDTLLKDLPLRGRRTCPCVEYMSRKLLSFTWYIPYSIVCNITWFFACTLAFCQSLTG